MLRRGRIVGGLILLALVVPSAGASLHWLRGIDTPLAQDLLDRFLRAGAVKVFVGPHTALHGPAKIVSRRDPHDNHMHVRIAPLTRRVLVGRSVRGRRIPALELGFPGPRRILVVGCIHGTECAGTAIVRRLERGSPPRFDLWVVPDLNPDGRLAVVRENARGVDLNRDFTGPGAFSEPETRFVRRLILRLRPRVTIWYHQHENRVRGWGQSIPAARRYARLSGMRFAAVRWPAGTGPNWQNHRFPAGASFVVELPAGSLTRAEIARHVWAILDLGK